MGIAACSLLSVPALAADILQIKSPDGQLRFRLYSQDQQLFFTLHLNSIPIIGSSPLQYTLDGKEITRGAVTGKPQLTTVNERFPIMGPHAEAVNQYNGVIIPIQSGSIKYSLELRVFNTGAGFRFIIPGGAGASRIPDEATVFNIPAGSTLWFHNIESHYEGVYESKEIGEVQNLQWVAPPGTFRLPQGAYGAITEAGLQGYPGMALQANGKNGLMIRLPQHQRPSYPYRLRYSPEDTTRLMQPAAVAGAITTPWRVVLAGADLNALVNTDVVYALCKPYDKKLFPEGIHTSWIKPGRAVWKYLDGGGDGTVEVMKKFTDGAAALGFEHNILEGFWTRWTDEQIRDLISYSNEKKIGIWFWVHSKGLHDDIKRKELFKRCHDLGVTGLKIDFFDHEAKETIDLYDAILLDAAQNHLLLDFHGANKPTGLSRTYPNEMVREAVKGMEARRIPDKAAHETTIPFTRWLAGPAEYTVVMFGERRGNTTRAHQIASAAILDAPLLTYAAHPDSLLASPAAGIIKSIPSTWDETIVLKGSAIGELAIYARRRGNTWFLAIMNGSTPRQVSIPLSFLKKGQFTASIAKDAVNDPAAIQVEQAKYTAANTINLSLEAGGGYIGRFTNESK